MSLEGAMHHEGKTFPQRGKEYSLVVGDSLKEAQCSEAYCSMRYGWKPDSVGRNGYGVFQMDRASNKVVVKLPHEQDEQQSHFFEGTYEPSKHEGKGVDCVAIFDPSTGVFRLEHISGSVKELK